ncbi:MAG: hypothetical protein C4288_21250 [Leptolyngbya sp. ERB_1_1]
MAQLLTYEEMKQQYPDEWLLIAYTKIEPDTLQVLEGEVVAHSAEVEEIYRSLPLVKGQDAAIEFVGQPQADVAYIL